MSNQTIDVAESLNSPILEAFKVLSANLVFNKKILNVISVTSFNPGEGKTSVAMNLAIANATSGTRVLYVDADLRKPRQLKRYGADNALGLTDFSAETELKDVISQTDIGNLECVTAGKRLVDPVEFLYSPSFDKFIEVASQQYQMVVIDSSSLGKFVDGAIIASKVAGVLVVTRSHLTRYKNIDRVKWQMKNVGANIIGIIINRVEKRDFKSYFVLPDNSSGLTIKLKLKLQQLTRNS